MTYTEQTSASDRYEAAEKALAEYDEHAEPRSIHDRNMREYRLAAALRALITPPPVGESEGEIAERVIRTELGEDWSPDRLYTMNIYGLAEAAVRAGIQSAHETWEPETAMRPSQEQMLRWLGISYGHRDPQSIEVHFQIIEREEI